MWVVGLFDVTHVECGKVRSRRSYILPKHAFLLSLSLMACLLVERQLNPHALSFRYQELGPLGLQRIPIRRNSEQMRNRTITCTYNML